MLAFLQANLATIVVAAIVFGAVALAVVYMVRQNKAGKSSCSCGGSCSGCPGSKYCHTR